MRHFSAKLYARHSLLPTAGFIEVFHRWIQQRRIDELLIDVADYTHVHHGPGVIIVGHESYYGMDEGEGRVGMQYRQRRGDPRPWDEGLRLAAARAVLACRLLEEDLGDQIRFDPCEILLGCDDRLEAPNDAATFEIAKPALLALGAQLFATDDPTSLAVSQAGEPRSAFRARLRHHKPSDCKVDLASIAQRLARGPGQA